MHLTGVLQITVSSITDYATLFLLYRIFSTFDADVDDSIVNSGPFPQPLAFGEVYCELAATCWVDAVAWSPSGQSLAFASKTDSLNLSACDRAFLSF
jgi:hypothetical protein